VVYVKEEVDGYRVTVDGKTIVFQKENDPTVIRAVSPGKLGVHMNSCPSVCIMLPDRSLSEGSASRRFSYA
jgi:hypothetical protein